MLAWRLANTLGADFCVEALEDALEQYGKPEIAFSFSFLVALLHHDWPFNVREHTDIQPIGSPRLRRSDGR